MAPLLTPEQAAELLGITPRQLHLLAADGAIAFIDIGRGKSVTRRFDPIDVESFKTSRRTFDKWRSTNRGRTAAPTGTNSKSAARESAAILKLPTSGRQWPRKPRPGP